MLVAYALAGVQLCQSLPDVLFLPALQLDKAGDGLGGEIGDRFASFFGESRQFGFQSGIEVQGDRCLAREASISVILRPTAPPLRGSGMFLGDVPSVETLG